MTDTLRDQLLGLGFKPAARVERPERTKAPERPHAAARGAPMDAAARQARHDAVRGRDGATRPTGDTPRAPGSDRRGARPPPGRVGPTGPGAAARRDRAPRAAGAAAHASANPPAKTPRSRDDIDLAKAYAIRAQREKDERIAAEKARQEEARLRREAKAMLAALLKDKALNDPAADIARHFDYGGKIKRIHVTADQLKALNAGDLGVVQLDGRYLLVTAALLAQAQEVFAPAVALRVDPAAPGSNDPYADPMYQVPDDLVW